MARVLLVGIDPDAVDYTDPALPPGLDADTIRRGIALVLDGLRVAGHDAQHLDIPTDPSDLHDLATRLASDPVDCVVVGGGVRLPPRNLLLFEAVLNTVVSTPSKPRIALVARPDDAVLAVARVLGQAANTARPPKGGT